MEEIEEDENKKAEGVCGLRIAVANRHRVPYLTGWHWLELSSSNPRRPTNQYSDLSAFVRKATALNISRESPSKTKTKTKQNKRRLSIFSFPTK